MTISEKQFQLIFEHTPLGMIIIGHLLNGRAVNEGDREVRYIHKDGRVIWVKIDVSAHASDPDGPMIIAVIEDITEQKKNETEVQMLRIGEDQMRESQEGFRGAFETASHGMGIVSTEGRWLKVNQTMCQIAGYTETELLATDFQTITHPDDLDKNLEFVNKLPSGTIESYQMEKRYVHKNGHYMDSAERFTCQELKGGTALFRFPDPGHRPEAKARSLVPPDHLSGLRLLLKEGSGGSPRQCC